MAHSKWHSINVGFLIIIIIITTSIIFSYSYCQLPSLLFNTEGNKSTIKHISHFQKTVTPPIFTNQRERMDKGKEWKKWRHKVPRRARKFPTEKTSYEIFHEWNSGLANLWLHRMSCASVSPEAKMQAFAHESEFTGLW